MRDEELECYQAPTTTAPLVPSVATPPPGVNSELGYIETTPGDEGEVVQERVRYCERDLW